MQHLEPNVTDKQTPWGDGAGVEDGAGNGLYVATQWREKNTPSTFIPRLERSRLEDEVSRHYVRGG